MYLCKKKLSLSLSKLLNTMHKQYLGISHSEYQALFEHGYIYLGDGKRMGKVKEKSNHNIKHYAKRNITKGRCWLFMAII